MHYANAIVTLAACSEKRNVKLWPRLAVCLSRRRRHTHRDSPWDIMRSGQRTFRPANKKDQIIVQKYKMSQNSK